MTTRYPLAKLLELVIDHRGRTPKKLGGDFADVGIRVLSATNVKGGRIDLDQELRYVTPAMHNAWMPEKLRYGDVLLTSEAPLGEAVYLQDANFCLGQRLFALRADPSILYHRFLYYSLRSRPIQQRLHARATGTTAQGIRQSELLKVELDVPPLPEQRAIAHILGTLDDKIELNRRMNKTLEEMARALFKSWFVDFDPVRAKAEGRQTAGIDAATAALFADSYDDSELGRIPSGWRKSGVGEIAVELRRQVAPERLVLGTPYIGLEHMPRRSISLADWGEADTLESAKFRFEQGDILFGKLRPYFHKVGVAMVDGVCSTDIVVMTPRTDIWFSFLLCAVSSEDFVGYTDSASTGTKMPRTNWRDMARYQLALPPEPLADAFDARVSRLFSAIRSNILENQSLSAMREALLPKLLSGEIRVHEAARSVEAVV